MTCERVMDVIDAGVFVDHSRQQLAAAHAHIRQCERCATALGHSESSIARFESMASPAPSRDLTQNVMARIAALETRVPQATTVEEQPARVPAAPASPWLPVAGAIAAAAATVLVTASVTSGESLLPSVAGFRMGLFAMPESGQELLAGAMGTALYVFGLLASDRVTDRRKALPRRRGDAENLTGHS